MIPEANELREKKKEYRQEVERLATCIWKSARFRIHQIKKGGPAEITHTIQSEIAFSASQGRLDLVENLVERHGKLSGMWKEIEELEQQDYHKRFGISGE